LRVEGLKNRGGVFPPFFIQNALSVIRPRGKRKGQGCMVYNWIKHWIPVFTGMTLKE